MESIFRGKRDWRMNDERMNLLWYTKTCRCNIYYECPFLHVRQYNRNPFRWIWLSHARCMNEMKLSIQANETISENMWSVSPQIWLVILSCLLLLNLLAAKILLQNYRPYHCYNLLLYVQVPVHSRAPHWMRSLSSWVISATKVNSDHVKIIDNITSKFVHSRKSDELLPIASLSSTTIFHCNFI